MSVRTGQTQKTTESLTETVKSHSETGRQGQRDHRQTKEDRNAEQAATVHSQKNHSVKIPEKEAAIREQEENVLLTEDHSVVTREKAFQEDVRKAIVRMKRNLSTEGHLPVRTEDQVLPAADHRAIALMRKNLLEVTENHTEAKESLLMVRENLMVLTGNLSMEKGSRIVLTGSLLTETGNHSTETENHSTAKKEKEDLQVKTENPEDRSLTALTKRNRTMLTKEEVTEGQQTVVQIPVKTVTGLLKSMLANQTCVFARKQQHLLLPVQTLFV